jgi:hypothetical protein
MVQIAAVRMKEIGILAVAACNSVVGGKGAGGTAGCSPGAGGDEAGVTAGGNPGEAKLTGGGISTGGMHEETEQRASAG